jgi:hypothetical protein
MRFPRFARAAGGATALGLAACAPALEPVGHSLPCGSDGGLAYLCGAEKPEDLASIPGTRWLVASGFAPGSGLKLIDTEARALRPWFTGEARQLAPLRGRYPDCEHPPEPALFNARGISLRQKGANEAELHVVNHGGRESVEVFTVTWPASGDAPQLSWRGCLRLPDGHVGNSVATYADGTVLVTVLTRPGTTITDFVRGAKTGVVLERPVAGREFVAIPGTELEGNNGLESARDDSGFYVVAFGTRRVVRFDRGDTNGPRWSAVAPEFMPDNIHWHGDRLLAAGMVRDEPACGGVRQIIDGVADAMRCHRGYVAALLDPATRSWSIVAYGEPSPSFNGVSAAVVSGRELWLGSYQADRLAVRSLPSPL